MKSGRDYIKKTRFLFPGHFLPHNQLEEDFKKNGSGPSLQQHLSNNFSREECTYVNIQSYYLMPAFWFLNLALGILTQYIHGQAAAQEGAWPVVEAAHLQVHPGFEDCILSYKYELRWSFAGFWSKGEVAVRMRGGMKSKGAPKA